MEGNNSDAHVYDDDEITSKGIDNIDNDDSITASVPVSLSPKVLSTTEAHIKDIEKLKENTNDLLDPAWKEQRNKHLISKMLELEEPAVTPKMVDFMVQEGVCEAMLAYVTRLNTGLERYIYYIVLIIIISFYHNFMY
jgi:hypothetical protein